jgi:hypothetical protein
MRAEAVRQLHCAKQKKAIEQGSVNRPEGALISQRILKQEWRVGGKEKKP